MGGAAKSALAIGSQDELPRSELYEAIIWAVISAYAIANILPIAPGLFPIGTVMAIHISLGVLFALLHGSLVYRPGATLAFIGLCLVIGGSAEQFGVRTAFPFGIHYFTDVMGPKLFQVPLFLVPAYVGIGYASWMLARLILNAYEPLPGSQLFSVPVVASFAMVAWDLAIDPMFSLLAPAWKWPDGGAYFGVPVSNFFGWFLTVFCIYQCFALYLRRTATLVCGVSRRIWSMPIIFYSLSLAGILLRVALTKAGDSTVVDGRGVAWRIADLNASTATVAVFTMGAFAFLAWAKLSSSSASLEKR